MAYEVNATIIELEFIEFPDTPDTFREAGGTVVQPMGDRPRYLLSLWDCTARVAWWNGDAEYFEDAGGLLNPAAIRAWAPLPSPLDYPAWGAQVQEAALNVERGDSTAGWLQPIYLFDTIET